MSPDAIERSHVSVERRVRRALNRIRYELETIEEEGFVTPDCWYALDRLTAIKDVCKKTNDGDDLACVSGFGKENEQEAQRFDSRHGGFLRRSNTTDGFGNTLEKNMELPILMNHENDKPIGVLREQDGKLFAEFPPDMKITKEACFEIFGGAGLQVIEATEEAGIYYISKVRIVEFSLTPSATVLRWRKASWQSDCADIHGGT